MIHSDRPHKPEVIFRRVEIGSRALDGLGSEVQGLLVSGHSFWVREAFKQRTLKMKRALGFGFWGFGSTRFLCRKARTPLESEDLAIMICWIMVR